MLMTHDSGTKVLRTADWHKSATRWTQLTFAEDDPQRYDPEFWIDVFKRTRSNATCLSAGGYIAYYPSDIPYHYVSKDIGDTDPFGTLVEGARSLDMHVMARIDPHAIHQDAADAHPEWVCYTAGGKPREHWALPGIWVTCAYGDYNRVFMTKVIEEIVTRYDVDAVFGNRWHGHGTCYCQTCQTNFREFSGYDLPTSNDAQDPVWQAWNAFHRTVLTDLVRHWDKAVKAIRPHASFIPNIGGHSMMEFDIDVIRQLAPILFVDHQGRHGNELAWNAGRQGKLVRATFRDRPVGLITSLNTEGEYRWKDSIQSGPEIEQWAYDGMAHGLFPWFTKFNAVVPDTRWVDHIAAAFNMHAEIEPVLGHMRPTAEIAVIDPATTLRNLPHDQRRAAQLDDMGLYHALVEARIPFECLSDQVLSPETLAPFKLVILANARYLSDAQCDELRDYVARGGNLIGAFETSLHDELGRRRDDFGLADVFGATLSGETRGPLKNTYLSLNGTHELIEGFDGAERIIGGTKQITVDALPGAETPLLYIPDFPDLPMEEVYPREAPRGAALIAREMPGGGRTVYFPWNIGEIFWHTMTTDHARLIVNAVHWALGKPPQVEIKGRGLLDIALHEGEGGQAVAMVNLTNPMMLRPPIREVYPVGPFTVSVRVPEGKSVDSISLLVSGETVSFTRSDDRVSFEVPNIAAIEVAHLSWS